MTSDEPIINQAISAFRSVAASPEFREAERLRAKARHDEEQALENARCEAIEQERQKWQGVAAEKNAENEKLRKKIAELQAKLDG